MSHTVRSVNGHPFTRADRLAVIGGGSHNVQSRVAQALADLNATVPVTLYDLKPATCNTTALSWIQVRDNEDLYRHLCREQPTHVLIETMDAQHADHILLALRAGVKVIYCEKLLTASTTDLPKLLPTIAESGPGQQVHIIDHYLNLDLVRLLQGKVSLWLGEVQHLNVVLHERQGVPPHQVASHADGMTNFLHHIVALASLLFDLDDLEPYEATWGKHPDSPVPDTYRSCRFLSKRTGRVVVDGSVGKYMASPRKFIQVVGTQGTASLDRDRNELRIHNPRFQPDIVIRAEGGADTGYRGLVERIATGSNTGNLLTVEQAGKILHLLEQAHILAEKIPLESATTDFVCDWQLVPSQPS